MSTSFTVSSLPTVRRVFRQGVQEHAVPDRWSIICAGLTDLQDPYFRKLAELMHSAEFGILAYHRVPTAPRRQPHSPKPIERLNGDVKKRNRVVGVQPGRYGS